MEIEEEGKVKVVVRVRPFNKRGMFLLLFRRIFQKKKKIEIFFKFRIKILLIKYNKI